MIEVSTLGALAALTVAITLILKKVPPAYGMIIGALIGGVIGAKFLFILKNPDRASFDNLESITSASGFSSQGALIIALLVMLVYARFGPYKLNQLLDAAAPAAIAAYAIARIGCFLAGDDCYGQVSDLPWAMAFPDGVAATNSHVHPLPLYEVIYSALIWFALTKRQEASFSPYSQFFLLLLSWGFCRFWLEFISTNPIKLFAMTGSQFGALLMFVAAISFFVWKKTNTSK